MTLPEFIAGKATWRDRLTCLVQGHHPFGEPYVWHPADEAEDRRARERPTFCSRCGKDGLPRGRR